MFLPAQSEQFTVSIAGQQCSYWLYGEASRNDLAVLLVHGFRGDHHGLERIASGIEGAKVIVPDVPGFGMSEALPESGADTLGALGVWLRDFIVRVHDGPVLLVGHSFGTLIVSAALSVGCPADQVVLINPISAPALRGPRALLSRLTLGYYLLAARLPRRLGDYLLKSSLIVRAMSELMTKTRDPDLRAWIHSQHGAYFSSFQDRDRLIDMFRASISHTVYAFRAVFTVPTIIIASDRDDITPLADQLVLTQSIPGARLVVIPEVGHLIHYEEPARVVEEIDRAAGKLSRSETA